MRKTFLFVALWVSLGGITPVMAADMAVSFEWGSTKKCFDEKSPPFKLENIPAGTKTLNFAMTDRNMMSFNHGGGKVNYTGQKTIPYGAFRYTGPCPGGESHVYLWTIKALDEKGKTLAKATVSKRFP